VNPPRDLEHDQRVSRALALIDAHPDVPSLPEDEAVPVLSIVFGILGIDHVVLANDSCD
jgi:hypothetical protein